MKEKISPTRDDPEFIESSKMERLAIIEMQSSSQKIKNYILERSSSQFGWDAPEFIRVWHGWDSNPPSSTTLFL